HLALNEDCLAGRGIRHEISVNGFAVYGQMRVAAATVPDPNSIFCAPTSARDVEFGYFRTDARADDQAVVLRSDAKQMLGDRHEVPGRCSGQPGIFGLAKPHSVLASDHLRVDIRFRAVYLADLFQVGRCNLFVVLEGAFPAPDHRLSDHDPGIVMAKDPG